MQRIGYGDLPQGMLDKLMDIEHFVDASGLDRKLLEMIRLRVAQLNGCAYCVDMHHKELKHAGESELRLASLVVWADTPYYSEKERATLAFTDQLTLLEKGAVIDDCFEALLNHFSKQEISYLSLAISQINTWTRLMKTFHFTPGKYQVAQFSQTA